jgi:hypothetical protein
VLRLYAFATMPGVGFIFRGSSPPKEFNYASFRNRYQKEALFFAYFYLFLKKLLSKPQRSHLWYISYLESFTKKFSDSKIRNS